MSRRHLTFACEGETLVGTIDEGDAATGLLVVSGGNEIRSGAFSGQARLAAAIAAKGFPVFRFDRRGVGDSEGSNLGFRGSRADILAAMAEFRAQSPHVSRVVAFGNCDAASALMLMGGENCDALVLSNPWTYDGDGTDQLPPPEAVRARYASKLGNPSEWWRLISGEVNVLRLLKGMASILRSSPKPSSLAQEMQEGLAAKRTPYVILIADRDRTGQAFAATWPQADNRIRHCEGATHAYVEPPAREWLESQLLEALEG